MSSLLCRSTGRRARTGVAVVLTATWLAVTGWSTTTAAAAESWGAGNWTYTAGTVCTEASGTTAPLAAWDVGASGPGFLTAPITSANSAVPPLASVGSQTRAAASAGSAGFTNASDIAAAADLIRQWGSSATPARVSEVAQLIMAAAGDSTTAGCTGQNGTTAAEAASMWADAQRYAGPYHLTLAPGPTSMSVRAVVTSASGVPVPGLPVTFTAPGSTLAVGLATTGADGAAVTSVTGPVVPAQIVATTTASVGLDVVTVAGAVPAVSLAAPTTISAASPVALNPLVDPAITTSTSLLVAKPGATIAAQAAITRLGGHQATVTLTVVGPLPFDSAGSCASLTTATWTSALAADPAGTLVVARTSQEIVGDTPSVVANFSPTGAGCYAVGATLVTEDASPNVTRAAAYADPASTVAVLDAAVAITSDTGDVIGSGALQLAVAVTGAQQFPTTVTGSVTGPVTPDGGSCTGVSWKGALLAARITQAAAVDGTTTLAAGSLDSYGCYAISITASIAVGDSASQQLDVSTSTNLLLLTPTIESWNETTWVPMNAQAHANVQVYGSLTQVADLTPELRWLPPQRLGCAGADYSHAPVVATGDAVETNGDGTYEIVAPPAEKAGCYSLVPILTLHANNAVRVAGVDGFPESIFASGADTSAARSIGTPESVGDDTPRIWISLTVVAVIVLLAAARAGAMAWRDERDWRRGGARHAPRDRSITTAVLDLATAAPSGGPEPSRSSRHTMTRRHHRA